MVVEQMRAALSRLASRNIAIGGVFALCLIACGDDGGNATNGNNSGAADYSAETPEDLPNCTEKREGETALVTEDGTTYKCISGKWELDVPIKSVETLDDLSNCTSKIDGDTVKVMSERAFYRCDDGKWQKYRAITDTLASADDLLACVLKRDGNVAYITEEQALYRCDDGIWKIVDPTSSSSRAGASLGAESSSSSNPELSSGSEKSSSSWDVESSSSTDSEFVDGVLTDSRDGQTYKTVTIGSQIWMAQNLNFETDASFCPENKKANCAVYGRLYKWAAAMDSVGAWSTNGKDCGNDETCLPTYPVRGVCPEGWHLPNSTEWEMLFNAVGGQASAGKELKSTYEWVRGSGTDAFGFSALPAGSLSVGGSDSEVGKSAYFWSSSKEYQYGAYCVELNQFQEDAMLKMDCGRDNTYAVRCLRDGGEIGASSSSTATASPCNEDGVNGCEYGTLKDSRDGQTYKTIMIGLQTWMAENLNYKVDSSYCVFNDESYCSEYGNFYSWAEVVGMPERECGSGYNCSLSSGNIRGVCPEGWHLPSKAEFETLFATIGGSSGAGMKLKSSSGWPDDGNGNDAFGFSAPYAFGFSSVLSCDVNFWSSTEGNSKDAYFMCLQSNHNDAFVRYDGKSARLMVRCIQD